MRDNEEIVREALHALATLAGNFEAAPNRVPRLINEQVVTIGLSLDALVAERDEQFAADNDRIHLLCEQREAAEAEVQRLREALTNIEGYVGTRDYAYVEVNDMAEIARAALGEDA
jgi:hypothetical protein